MEREAVWKNFDYWLFGAVIILCAFGVAMIRSAIAGNETLAYLVSRQMIFIGVSLVVILGMGGIGKTSLATKLAQVVLGQFEFVIWRSLRNAPPAEEILDEILRVLDPGATLDPVPKLDRHVKRLLEHLRRQRCLIILDNFEAILAEGERAGAEYARRLGELRCDGRQRGDDGPEAARCRRLAGYVLLGGHGLPDLGA